MDNVRYSSELLFNKFEELDLYIDPEMKAVWLYFNSKPRSCYTIKLLSELDKFQNILRHHDGKLACNGASVDIDYCVITSNHPVFSFGGDLEYFISCIESGDRAALRHYAKLCIDAVYYSYIGREFDITTISLIHGNALGGGFEAALSSQVVIAEESAEMGFPEVLFNLFPGMGAYNLLTQRVSPKTAEKLMLSGNLYHARELEDIGVIDQVVDDGDGVDAVNAFMRSNRKRLNTLKCLRKTRQISSPINYQDLIDIGEIWVEAAFEISDKDLRTMSRLVRSQKKHSIRSNQIINSVSA